MCSFLRSVWKCEVNKKKKYTRSEKCVCHKFSRFVDKICEMCSCSMEIPCSNWRITWNSFFLLLSIFVIYWNNWRKKKCERSKWEKNGMEQSMLVEIGVYANHWNCVKKGFFLPPRENWWNPKYAKCLNKIISIPNELHTSILWIKRTMEAWYQTKTNKTVTEVWEWKMEAKKCAHDEVNVCALCLWVFYFGLKNFLCHFILCLNDNVDPHIHRENIANSIILKKF